MAKFKMMSNHRLVNLFFWAKEGNVEPWGGQSKISPSMKSHELTNQAKTCLTHILF